MRYAQNTEVSSDKSRMEIERILQKYGASGFMYGWKGDAAVIAFEMHGKSIKFILPLPNKNDKKFKVTPKREYLRTEQEAYQAWEQACRQKWRALTLCIKAKLEASESGITTFEHEFLAHFVMPGGQIFGDYIIPQIEEVRKSGKLPKLMIGHEI